MNLYENKPEKVFPSVPKSPNEEMKGLCRACLGVPDSPKSLFSEDVRRETPAYLVWKCTGVRPTEGDGLPEVLCRKCFMHLSIANRFRLLVQKSNNLLLQCAHLAVPLEPRSRIKHDADVAAEDFESIFIMDFKNENENTNVTVEDIESQFIMDFKNENTNVTAEDNKTEYCNDSENKNVDIKPELTGNTNDIDISVVKIEAVESDSNDNFCNNESTNDGLNKEYAIEYDFDKTDNEIRDHPSDSENENGHFIHKNKTVTELGQDKKFKCDECDKCFTRKDRLRTHIIAHNTIQPKYTCPECDKEFKLKQSINRHRKKHHMIKGNFPCTLCDKKLEYKSTLNRHMLTHTDPFRCKPCKLSFNTRIELTNHKSTQHSEERYTCHLCEFETNVKRYLNEHLVIHNPDKKYACHLCKFVTNVNKYLTSHLATHYKIKKHICHLCGFATHSKQSLYYHKNKKHRNEIPVSSV